MHKIVVDPPTLAKLDNLDSRLEICDQSGRTLGYFVPSAEQGKLLYDWARQEFTDEEIDAARNESGGYRLDEILAELNGA